MVVISDTSPISALIRLGELPLLFSIFNQEIILPYAVYEELLRLQEFGYSVEETLDVEWLTIKSASPSKLFSELKTKLDPGEAEAIALASEQDAVLLIMDERNGVSIAQSLNIETTGLIGVLVRAKRAGIIPSLRTYLDRLRSESQFFISKGLYQLALKLADEE